MADTVRTLDEILALLPDNSTGAIDPQDLRDQTVTLYRDIIYDDYAAFAASTEVARPVGSIVDFGDGRGVVVASGGDIQNSAGPPMQLKVLQEDFDYNVKAFGIVGDGSDETEKLFTAMSRVTEGDDIYNEDEPRSKLDLEGLTITITASGSIEQTLDGRTFASLKGSMRNGAITSVDNISVGVSYLGKYYTFDDVYFNSNSGSGIIRVTGWYASFDSVRFRGVVSFEADQPPTSSNYGQYYNTFKQCRFIKGFVHDMRYGPFNHNKFDMCRFFRGCHVFDSGSAGYTSGTPSRDFHSNSFYSCEWYIVTGDGITYNGVEYSFVIEPDISVGGVNYIYSDYEELSCRGFYGDFVIKGSHHSGNAGQYGGGKIGYRLPLEGNNLIDKGVPLIYPVGNVNLARGGDFSEWAKRGATTQIVPHCVKTSSSAVLVTTLDDTPFGGNQVLEISGSDKAFDIRPSITNTGTDDLQNYHAAFYMKIKTAGDYTAAPRFVDTSQGANGTGFTFDDGWQLITGPTNDRYRIYFPAGSTAELYIGPMAIYDGGGLFLPSYKEGRKTIFTSTIPAQGTWAVGDIAYNDAPSAGGTVGWVCTTAGTPGTWKTFGSIAA